MNYEDDNYTEHDNVSCCEECGEVLELMEVDPRSPEEADTPQYALCCTNC